MKNGEETANPLHIQPLNDDLLANLSIEELEGRLEMQILHLTEAQFCYDCTTRCDQDGCPQEGCPDCGPLCTPECGTNCPDLCSGDCSSFCSADCAILI
jgi:hypothetical protein